MVHEKTSRKPKEMNGYTVREEIMANPVSDNVSLHFGKERPQEVKFEVANSQVDLFYHMNI